MTEAGRVLARQTPPAPGLLLRGAGSGLSSLGSETELPARPPARGAADARRPAAAQGPRTMRAPAGSSRTFCGRPSSSGKGMRNARGWAEGLGALGPGRWDRGRGATGGGVGVPGSGAPPSPI